MSTNKQITVYTQASCMKCTMVKNFLDGEGLDYEEVYLDTEEKREDFRNKGYMSTPVTMVGTNEVHGFDIASLKALI